MESQPDEAAIVRSRPGSLTLRLTWQEGGFFQWSLSWALVDQHPSQAPALATGVLWSLEDAQQTERAFQKALSQLLGSAGELHQ